jgi:hypothetical protein
VCVCMHPAARWRSENLRYNSFLSRFLFMSLSVCVSFLLIMCQSFLQIEKTTALSSIDTGIANDEKVHAAALYLPISPAMCANAYALYLSLHLSPYLSSDVCIRVCSLSLSLSLSRAICANASALRSQRAFIPSHVYDLT